VGIVSSVLFLHLEASRLTYIQRCPFNYFSVDFLAWQPILSDLSRSAARYRIMTHTISKFNYKEWFVCFLCLSIRTHDHWCKHLELDVRIPIVQAMCCLDADIKRYWCGAVFWEDARNSVQRGTTSLSWYLLAIEQCHKKKDQKIFWGNYFSRGKFCIKVLFKWLDFWSTCINPA